MPPKPKVIRYFQTTRQTPQTEIAISLAAQSNVSTSAFSSTAPSVVTNSQQACGTLSTAAMDPPISGSSCESSPSQPNGSAETLLSPEGEWVVAHSKRICRKDRTSIVEGNKEPQGSSNTKAKAGNDERNDEQNPDMNEMLHERIRPARFHRRNQDEGNTERQECHSDYIRRYYEDMKKPNEPGSWLTCPETPTSKEILDQNEKWQRFDPTDKLPVLRGNQVMGPWESKEEYLRAHHEMLREDAVRPLREAVSYVKRFSDKGEDKSFAGNIGIYEKVHITAVTFSLRGIGVRVAFSLGKVGKSVRWEQSKRLISGSLVILTPSDDMFQTKCIVAVVAARPLELLMQNPPEIDLFFARPEEIEIDSLMEFTMVEERSGFFEASRHTMTALQRMKGELFPLQEHLVNVQRKVEAPSYLSNQSHLNMTSAFHSDGAHQYNNVDVLHAWPEDPSTELDKSQLSALQRILTKRLAIVQGPPGTGKTHVSVLALKVMLDNMSPGDPPIIVACQTNHALDQLLRHIAPFEKEFARLGGRSKDQDVIKKRTLYVLRQGKNLRVPGGMRYPAKASLDKLSANMCLALAPLEMGKGEPNHTLFLNLGLLTLAQCESLEKGDPDWSGPRDTAEDTPPLKRWLGRQLLNHKRNRVADDFPYEFEEVDLEYEQIKELEAENCAQDDDEDYESLRGPAMSLRDDYVGKQASNFTDDEIRHLLLQENLWKINSRFRGAVYNYLQRLAKQMIRDTVRELAIPYYENAVKFKAGGWERDAILLRKQRIIGMTTTGFSKYRPLIASLNPKIVMIEEAAETQEAHVSVACVPTTQHLILVGDHQQLRPQCAVKVLEVEPFSMTVSLFERMVKNYVEYSMLKRQRRMVPEIRRILNPIYGNAINDHPSMAESAVRPAVPGMGGVNSCFFTHSWPEDKDEQKSAINWMEADMVVGLFDYLIHNGMTEQQITVLTFYNGQRKLLLRKLRSHGRIGNRIFKVVTVDSYQGEENDIVILSLVRSNNEGHIGFLGVENRICVALSRARCGFYMFGNAELLACESKIWAKVVTIMAGKTNELPPTKPKCRVVFKLPLVCSKHERKTWITEPQDWETINGGCQKKCLEIRNCGHECALNCHPFSHDKVACEGPCARLLPCGHSCIGLCGDLCMCKECKFVGDDKKGDPSPSSSTFSGNGALQRQKFADGGFQQHDSGFREMRVKELNKTVKANRTNAYLEQQASHLGREVIQAAASVIANATEPVIHTNSASAPREKPTITAQRASRRVISSNEGNALNSGIPQRHKDRFKRSGTPTANSNSRPFIGYVNSENMPTSVGTQYTNEVQPCANGKSHTMIQPSHTQHSAPTFSSSVESIKLNTIVGELLSRNQTTDLQRNSPVEKIQVALADKSGLLIDFE